MIDNVSPSCLGKAGSVSHAEPDQDEKDTWLPRAHIRYWGLGRDLETFLYLRNLTDEPCGARVFPTR